MSEHERTITVDASPQETFRFLSSVSNLPDFVPYLQSLRQEENDHVFGVSDFGEGRRREVSGFFRPDEANMRLDWESDGTPGYRGWLQIGPEGANRSRITVHISMPSAAAETPPAEPGLAGERIERGLDSSLKAIREAIEGRMARSR